MEMLGLCTRFSPTSPAARSGPLCRSAASGHSEERARALLAPPPFLAARTAPPRPGSHFGPAFCRETLDWRLRGARPVWAAPPGSLGKGRDRLVPASLATRPGAEARGRGRAPA